MVTRWYRAWEIAVNKPYDERVDRWSVGCIIYEFLTSRVLFDADCDLRLADMIKTQLHETADGCTEFTNPDPSWSFVATPPYKLMMRMLSLTPKQRCNATEALGELVHF